MWSSCRPASSSAVNEVLRVLPSSLIDRLHSNLNILETDFNTSLRDDPTVSRKKHFKHLSVPVIAGFKPSIYTLYNHLVAEEFGKLTNDLFIGSLPSSLNHYPDMQIVSCNVKELFAGSVSLRDQSTYDVHLCGKDRSELASLYQDRMEFLEALVDSPAFLDFLNRNGAALDCSLDYHSCEKGPPKLQSTAATRHPTVNIRAADV